MYWQSLLVSQALSVHTSLRIAGTKMGSSPAYTHLLQNQGKVSCLYTPHCSPYTQSWNEAFISTRDEAGNGLEKAGQRSSWLLGCKANYSVQRSNVKLVREPGFKPQDLLWLPRFVILYIFWTRLGSAAEFRIVAWKHITSVVDSWNDNVRRNL